VIPTSPSRKLLSRRGGIVVNKVKDLIDPHTRGWAWDEDPLCGLLFPVDVQRILRIPLSQHEMDDVICLAPFKERSVYSKVNLSLGMVTPIWTVSETARCL
jgi:hypothetical protein